MHYILWYHKLCIIFHVYSVHTCMRVHVDSRGQPWTLFFRCCLPFEKYLFTFLLFCVCILGQGLHVACVGWWQRFTFLHFVCVLGWLYWHVWGDGRDWKSGSNPPSLGWSPRQLWSPVAAEILASDPLSRLSRVFWGGDSHWGLTVIDEARLPAARPEDLPASTSQLLGLQVLATMPSLFFPLCLFLFLETESPFVAQTVLELAL